jgi:hypothetical protein
MIPQNRTMAVQAFNQRGMDLRAERPALAACTNCFDCYFTQAMAKCRKADSSLRIAFIPFLFKVLHQLCELYFTPKPQAALAELDKPRKACCRGRLLTPICVTVNPRRKSHQNNFLDLEPLPYYKAVAQVTDFD